jgi:hypothetical protein
MSIAEKGNVVMTTGQNAATVATSPWEQATLLINGKKVEWGAELVLLRGQANDVTVEAPPAIARELNLVLAENGGLSIVASPDFERWVVPVDGKFNWTITPRADKSGRITLVFFSREVLESWEHRSLVISRNLADEAELWFKDRLFRPGERLFPLKGGQSTLMLKLRSDSPVNDLQLKLEWGQRTTASVRVTPQMDIPQVLNPKNDASWDIYCGNNPIDIGTFSFLLKSLEPQLADLEVFFVLDSV